MPAMARCFLAAMLALTAAVFAQGHDELPELLVTPPQDNARLTDPLSRFAKQVVVGQVSLAFEPGFGHLRAVLRALKIPVSSQVLVFSKTSLQHEAITPRTPRALYFNDDTYVGFVPDGSQIEMSVANPELGAVFYAERQSPDARPGLVRNQDCFQCHATALSRGLPAHLLRSVFTLPDGQVAPRTPAYLTDHRSPLAQRWGGWFVSGTFSGDVHMGNVLFRAGMDPETFDRAPGTAVADISHLFYSNRYLSPASDVVALLVLDHQVQMHNLIAALHYDASHGRPWDDALEALLRYALFVDEAPLKGPVKGPTTFAADFEKRGPFDARGRSLRQFDLRMRLFRYPCSYLLYSDAFLGLPAEVKSRFYARLRQVLSGSDDTGGFERLQAADRTAIFEILSATHSEFAAAR
jgi:hypothetical protein